MSIYSYYLKKLSFLSLFFLWGFYSFASASDIVDESRPSVFKSFNCSDESLVLYQQAIRYAHVNDLDKFEVLMRKSAEGGHPEAAYVLGNYYHLTTGEKEKALIWYTVAHNNNYSGIKQILDSLIYEIAINAAEKKAERQNEETKKNLKKSKNKIKEDPKTDEKSPLKKTLTRSKSEKFLDRMKISSSKHNDSETISDKKNLKVRLN